MSIENLKRLYEEDNFIEFCKEYNSSNSIFMQRISSDFFVGTEPAIAVKYVELILYKQEHAYSIKNLTYLIENNFTDKLIKFFKHLENIKDRRLCPEIVSGEELLDKIISRHELHVLEYFIDNPTLLLIVFSNKTEIFKQLLEKGFKQGLLLFKQKVPNAHLFLVDFIVNKMWVKKDNYYCDEYYDMLQLKDKSLLKFTISDYVADKQIHPKDIEILDNYGGMAGKARELKDLIERKKVNNLYDDIAKTLWNNYYLESILNNDKEITLTLNKI